jgi:hypothetical protein
MRTISNMRPEDPYFFNNISQKEAEAVLEENEN